MKIIFSCLVLTVLSLISYPLSNGYLMHKPLTSFAKSHLSVTYQKNKQLSPLLMTENSISVEGSKKSTKLWDFYLKTTDTLTTLFPVWTVLFAGLALTRPQSFAWFTTKYFTASLGIYTHILLKFSRKVTY